MPTVPSDPVFVIGAPRSGTSILTWCLGQHPDILPMEESNWMGDFAAQAGAAHAVGSLRGERSQLSACGLSLEAFLAALGERINALLLGQREAQSALAEQAAQADPRLVNRAIQLARDPSERKGRWVDGTPENSLHLPALRMLFPGARFVHIVREARSVVKSMLLFEDSDGRRIVHSEAEAYRYWMRCVQACLAAERAWGSRIVLRVRYRDLAENRTALFQRVLEFLSLPFAAACLEPLQVRLNSSRVPPEFDPRDEATDPALREEAERLCAELQAKAHPEVAPDEDAAAAQSAAFARRVDYFRRLDANYLAAQALVDRLDRQMQERSAWALDLDRQLAAANRRIVELQKEVEERNAWARDLNREIAAARERIAALQKEGQDG
jgi:hypothetical protein